MDQSRFERFILYDVYGLATLIDKAITEAPFMFFNLVEWNKSNIKINLLKPQKTSLLHHFIHSALVFIELDSQRDHWKHVVSEEVFEEIDNQTIESYQLPLEKELQLYGLRASSFVRGLPQPLAEDDNKVYRTIRDHYFAWIAENKSLVDQLLQIQSREVFHLLFGNRNFLLNFHQQLAIYIQKNYERFPSNYFTNQGKLRRTQYVPKWLQRAVFYRDKGRCVLCLKDLSGLLNTVISLELDHIVPLNLFGTNDATNFQLLCTECNSGKSGNAPLTGDRYIPWWEDSFKHSG